MSSRISLTLSRIPETAIQVDAMLPIRSSIGSPIAKYNCVFVIIVCSYSFLLPVWLYRLLFYNDVTTLFCQSLSCVMPVHARHSRISLAECCPPHRGHFRMTRGLPAGFFRRAARSLAASASRLFSGIFTWQCGQFIRSLRPGWGSVLKWEVAPWSADWSVRGASVKNL